MSLPFIKDLRAARRQDHAEASKEVSLNILLSLMPIWLNTIVMSLHPQSGSFFDNIWTTLQAGELYLYSAALIAPLYYFIFSDYGESRFPESRLFMLFGLLIFLLAAVFFTARRSLELFSADRRPDEELIFVVSLVIYVMAALLVYVANVYKHLLMSTSVRQRESTGAFVDEFRRRRRR